MAKEISKSTYLKVKDHSVSKETFELLYDLDLDMLETFPQPTLEKLPDYYKSDDYISHTDSKRNLFEKAYHFIKSIALKRKLKLINSVSNTEKRLLDFGCGTGDFLEIAQKNGWQIQGIEPNEKARSIANQKTKNTVFETSHFSKFNQSSFDVITLWHVLEHLPDLDSHITQFKTLLKPNGTLIIAVPNFKSHDANHYKELWAAYDVPRHLWHFSKTAISKLVAKQNLEVIQIHPMKFDAYYVSLLSEKYKSGTMNPFKAFWNGWQSNRKAKRSGEYSSLIYVIKKHEN
uniref:class I SAM-dependent methyltransferase n=1 Tax=Gelidibacter sp. TaxID=2018083 RepID=UPI00404B9217